MLALRYAAVLALACWGGGLFLLGTVAAPTAFEVLGARGADGRLLAGATVGAMLQRFNTVAYLCGATILITLAVRGVLGPRPRLFSVRHAVSTLMLGAALYAGAVLTPRILRAQAEIGAAPSTLPGHDSRRAEFARLHGMSMSLQLIPFAGSLLLLFLELKD